MKWQVTLFFFLVFHFTQSQIYQRTGEGFGVQLNSSSFILHENERNENKLENFGLGVSMLQMIKPGLYYKVGYSRVINTNEARNVLNGNAFNLGFGFDKFLLNLADKKVGKICLYHKLGLIGEVNYSRFYSVEASNKSNGEVILKLGLSYHTHFLNMQKKSKARTVHWELFYFNGITPYFKASGNTINRHGLGLQVRIMKHKVRNFLM